MPMSPSDHEDRCGGNAPCCHTSPQGTPKEGVPSPQNNRSFQCGCPDHPRLVTGPTDPCPRETWRWRDGVDLIKCGGKKAV